ncbi:MAG: hypothetical protein FJ216_05630 [Ignavibacteria bacterium]|nr:hypothetical protein [Ignavibacteria bacterium]
MKIFLISSVILLFLVLSNLYCQVSIPSMDSVITANYINTYFENNNNNTILRSNINLNAKYRQFQILIRNTYSSDVTKISGKLYRDINNTVITGNYILSSKFKTGPGFQRQFLSDEKSVELSSNRFNYYFLNADYKPFNGIDINTKIGYKDETQIGEQSEGIRVSLFSQAVNQNLNGFLTNGNVNLFYENLAQKINYNYAINGDIFKLFSVKSENRAIIRINNTRNDFYIPSPPDISSAYSIKNNIQTRAETFVYLQDNFRYSPLNNFEFKISGAYYLKSIHDSYKYKLTSSGILSSNIYDSKINENNLQVQAEIQYNITDFFAKAIFKYAERSEVHSPDNTEGVSPNIINEIKRIESIKSNNSRIAAMGFDLTYRLSGTNSLSLITSSSLLKYDTESKENYDDRDELYVLGTLSHKYNNLRNFSVETSFDINYSVLNYILKERSSNNYQNKIYKLTTKSIFEPLDNFLTINYFQVLANYTIYKYEDPVSQVRSFSFRQLYFKDSTLYRLSRIFSVDFTGDIKIYEQADFNKNNFSVKPFRYYDERKCYSYLNCHLFEVIKLSAGFEYFVQKQYDYINGEKTLKRTFENYGPVIRIIMYFGTNSIIDFRAVKYYTKSSDSQYIINNDNIQINIIWNI